jgi:type IV fimbrial biogenesis protein FimT
MTAIRRQPTAGFTLIELMVTVAVLAIVLRFAIPGMNDVILSNRLTSYANDFVSSALLARGEAIKRNRTVTLCAAGPADTSCAASGGWQQGWIVADLTVPADPQIIRRQAALDTGYQLRNAATTTIEFRSTGLPNTALTMSLCKTTTETKPTRALSVSATGQVAVGKAPYPLATCPSS